jgi:hypothetical protein
MLARPHLAGEAKMDSLPIEHEIGHQPLEPVVREGKRPEPLPLAHIHPSMHEKEIRA